MRLIFAYDSASVISLRAVVIGIMSSFFLAGGYFSHNTSYSFTSSVYFSDYGVLKYTARYVKCCTKLHLQHITLAK